jgi:hypothetical protein
MTHMGRTLIAALGLALATVAVGGADAAPSKEKRRHQQVMPTGAEDAPAAAAKAKAAAAPADTGEALIEHITRKDSVGLYQEMLPDGSITVNLDERFQQVSRVVQNDDGTTQVVCDDKPLAPKKAAKKARSKAAKRAPAPVSKSSALEEM